ncbi:1974_t:CDS:2 [Ambispora gerdemannii]|uniref:1974_t:CDS:1 n=1 Tax=Ambispora gerdemannii TaxID=144530 RepID=A0A9N8UYE2_9GLOM|nr:1974_t:CDS:2 [Ambispora gerdemannii]
MQEIPVIDFSSFENDQSTCAQKIKSASESVGFFYLRNHGIPDTMINEMFSLSQRYFNHPINEKILHEINEENQGYSRMHQEILDPKNQKIGDFKEAFNFGKIINGKPSQILPPIFQENMELLSSFEQASNKFIQSLASSIQLPLSECHNLCLKVLQTFAIALEIPESEGGKNWFESRHSYDRKSGDTLRILHYPPMKTFDSEEMIPPIIPGCILINLGDLLEFWTKGLLKSTKHRVVFRSDTCKSDRYSIAYFCHAVDDVPLIPIPSNSLAINAGSRRIGANDSGNDGNVITAVR